MKTYVQYDLIARLYTFQSIANLEMFKDIFGHQDGLLMLQKFENSFHKNSVSFFAWMNEENRELFMRGLEVVNAYKGILDKNA